MSMFEFLLIWGSILLVIGLMHNFLSSVEPPPPASGITLQKHAAAKKISPYWWRAGAIIAVIGAVGTLVERLVA